MMRFASSARNENVDPLVGLLLLVSCDSEPGFYYHGWKTRRLNPGECDLSKEIK